MHIEPGLYPSIVDIVEAMNNKTRERLGVQYNGFYVSENYTKGCVHLPENQSVFFFSKF